MFLSNINYLKLPTPFGFRYLACTTFKVTTAWLKVKSRPTCIMTHPNQCSYRISTSYTFCFPRYALDKVFNVKVTTARSNVKSRLNHGIAQLHPLTNIPTKYQHPTAYSSWFLARTSYSRRPPDRLAEGPPTKPDAMDDNNNPKSFRLWGKIGHLAQTCLLASYLQAHCVILCRVPLMYIFPWSPWYMSFDISSVCYLRVWVIRPMWSRFIQYHLQIVTGLAIDVSR